MRELTKENIIDMLYGCTVLGTGGGGSLEEGIEIMQKYFDAGKTLKLVSLGDIPDDEYVATPYGCGAPTALGIEKDKKYSKLPQLGYPASILAFRSLEEFLGKKLFAVSATELGGLNTAEALLVALELGLPIIDGDPAGRSVPELQHTTYFVKGIPITPMAVATEFGDVAIIKNVVDDFRAEDLVRAMAVASGNSVGVADHPITGKRIRDAVIPESISYAIKIGEILRKANVNGENVAEKIAQSMEGKLLFVGTVESMPWECVGGFNIGEIYLHGTELFQNQKYRIWFKNENIISYKNDVVDVTVPDLICMIGKNGKPLTNPNFKVGDEMSIIALPSPEIWKTKKGLECLSPRSFGFDIDYVPFNK